MEAFLFVDTDSSSVRTHGKITEFLLGFGKGLGLESFVDEAGNVIIRKPATPGMENRKGVILQAHMDMVPQKNNDTVHDFEKDPIETYIDGDWVKAKVLLWVRTTDWE